MINFKSRPRGFSLIEAMFSAAIVTVTLGSFLYSLNQYTHLIETMRLRDIAFNAAQEKLEEISNSDRSQIVQNYNGKTFAVDSLVCPEDKNNPLSVEAKQVIPGDDSLFDVKVTVSWQQAGSREMSETISTTFAVE